MANLRNCIEKAAAAGRITRAEATEIGAQLDDLEGQLILRNEYSPETARTIAEQAVLDARLKKISQDRRHATLQAVAIHRAVQRAQAHPRGFSKGIMGLLVKDPGREARGTNVEYRGTAILGEYHRRFADGLAALRTKNLGLSQDAELARNIVRELFGTDTGVTKAVQLAKILGDTLEYARVRFNQAGGNIPKLERGIGYGLPQYHDPVRVRKVSQDEWIDKITPLLDRENITSEIGVPLNNAQFRIMMERAYDSIITDGFIDLTPGQMGGRKLANRRQDHRVLAFKDADSWLKYSDEFGHQDIYTTLTDHLNSMSRDTALLEVMGPNPEHTFRYLYDLARKKGDINLTTKEGAKNDAYVQGYWKMVSGKADQVKWPWLADIGSAVRHYLVSAQLGSAFLSAIADVGFLKMTTKLNGMPVTKSLKRMMTYMGPWGAETRLLAVRNGLVGDAWVNRALAANRHVEVTGAGFSAKVADFTMRVSLLSPWTDGGRKGFGLELMANIADQMKHTFDELDPGLQAAFNGYGITREDWNILRTITPLEHDGVKFFSMEELMNHADISEGVRKDLASKVLEMTQSEMDHAIPMPDSRTRIYTTGTLQRGTVSGELVRLLGMYKSFPITVLTTHLIRGMRKHGLSAKAAYLGQLTLATTLMGAVALQMKDISKGRDPRSMDDASFWTASFIQGGGAGIFGDFVYAGIGGESRFGSSLLETAAGPAFGFGEDLFADLIGNNAYAIMQGKDANIPGDVVQFMRRYMPGGSLWYTRLAWERGVIDQLSRMVDPKARKRLGRMVRKRRKEYGQDYWWRPGEAMPARLPAQ